MNVYDDITKEIIDAPDLTSGYLYDGKYLVAHHEAVDPVTRIDILPGTEHCNNGKGLRGVIIVSPGSDAWDEYEDCQYYHKYTEDDIEKEKEIKIKEISDACNTAITNGMDIELSNDEIKHFTYSIEDQSNINSMFRAVFMGATKYPYHTGPDFCEIYSAQDIITIYLSLSSLVTIQTTYHNMLKHYVQSLEKIQDIRNVSYGQQLTGEYLEKYNEMIEVANEQMQIVISKISQSSV